MIETILPFLLSHLILFYGLAYTHPHSRQRPFLVGIIIAFCWVSTRSSIVRLVPGMVGGEYAIGFAFHASHYLLAARLEPPFPLSASPGGRRAWAFEQVFTARWGVAFIPPWNRKYPNQIPSRMQFLLLRAWDAAWTFGLIYLLRRYRLNVESEDIFGVPPGFLRRLGEVTLREAIVRFYLYLWGFVEVYCSLRGCYAVASLVGVLGYRNHHVRWPPLFGRVTDAYTVRRYYGCVAPQFLHSPIQAKLASSRSCAFPSRRH